jgi:hypothetical protein
MLVSLCDRFPRLPKAKHGQLFTHANLMFTNPCLELQYEATTAAIVMAGLFVSFTVDYACHRLAKGAAKRTTGATQNADPVTVIVLEAGIIFHSLRTSSPTKLCPLIFR